MKKIIIGLIAFAMVTFTGSAIAWDVDITIGVQDTNVDITATATTNNYVLATAAGVDGTGQIGVHGEGDSEGGYMITGVSGEGELYAAQGLGSTGSLVDCDEEPCDECPDYEYSATSSAAINGQGTIILAQAAGYDTQKGNINAQILAAHGEGDFTAGMMSRLWVEGMEEPVGHAMGATGQNVGFCVFGIHGMDTGDGTNAGYFTADMNFLDEGCDGNDCSPNPVPE